ncbi:hypothetical protein HDF22_000666 [Mucilaginibacter lappiensis]|uniref:Uncharacterized protein n=1 Tax=Mucilaginibacter lappiensis TaxID=354630 RepID=A0A841JEQ3_9SPHI|nr:hypothetical protein [Mucilaginibacter lappiensis]MBB6126561.1 hypothetical protein [Mucilaginibacter lappiensis]
MKKLNKQQTGYNQWKYTQREVPSSQLQSPKAMNTYGAMAGLLTYSPLIRPSRRDHIETVATEWIAVNRAYSCGTVPELHRIPF